MEDVEEKPPSEPYSTSAEPKPQAETPEESTKVINQSSIEASMNQPSNNNTEESSTHFPETESSDLKMSLNASDGQAVEQDKYLHTDNSSSGSNATIHGTEQSHQGAVVADSEPKAVDEDIFNRPHDGVSTATASGDVDNLINLSTSSSEIKEFQTGPIEQITDLPQTKVTDASIDNSASTPNVIDHVTEQSNEGDVSADSEPGALEDISNQQQDGGSTVNAGRDIDNQMELSTSSTERKEPQNDHKELKIDPSQTEDTNVALGAAGSTAVNAGNGVDNQINLSPSENIELQNDRKELKIESAETEINTVSVGGVDSPAVSDDNQTKLLASSFKKIELPKGLKIDSSPSSITDAAVDSPTQIAAVDSPTQFAAVDSPTQIAAKRGLIDTTAPFESVKEAVSKFGGIVDWKAHRVQTVERRKHVEHELDKVQHEIPEYKKKSVAAEKAKVQVLQELDSTKRLIEELKLNLERAQTEERQARQDSELAKLRVEEMEQGIADDSSVAAKAQLEVAKARYSSAITELTYVTEELEALRGEFSSLITEKDEALMRAEEAFASSKQVEKTVEDLTIELIATKEALESAHAAHMEAEEHRIGSVMAKDQDSLNWDKELKQAEEEVQSLHQKILSVKDLKSKLSMASSLLLDLKAELNEYMESKSSHEGNEGIAKEKLEERSKKRTHNQIQQAVASAKTELGEVKLNIEKATTEVNYLKVAAASLRSELEKEKLSLASIMQREGMASITVSSLEADLDNTRSEMVLVKMKEKEGRERIIEIPKKLQQAVEEATQANWVAQAAREELRRVTDEAEQAKASASTMQSKLLAAQKEIEAARASERFAIAACRALKESESTRNNNNELDSSSWVTLSVEEYYNLSKQAYDAEEQANVRVASANSEIEKAKESELRTLGKLNDVNNEMATRRESLKIAMAKAEKAREGKLGAEQELRKWRADHEQRRKAGAGGVSQGVAKQISKGPRWGSFEKHKEANNHEQPHSAPAHSAPAPLRYFSSSKTHSHAHHDSDGKPGKKKKKSFFPWVLMFFGKKKSHSTTHQG